MARIDLIEQFSKFLRRVNYSEKTVTCRFYSVKRFSRWIDVSIDEVTPTTVYSYLGYLHHRRLKPSTINSNLISISRFYDYLYHEKKLRIPNPVKPEYMQRLPKPLPKFLTDHDVSILFNTIKNKRDFAMFLLMLRCGLRVEELANLTIAAIDFGNSRILVLNGKFRKDRIVYVSHDAQEALKDYLETRKRYSTQKIFLGQKWPYRDKPLSIRAIQKRIEKYATDTGVTVSCHRLRHTMATQLLNAGAMLASVQELMGHNCISSTQRYAKISNVKVRKDYFKAVDVILAQTS